MEMNAKGSGWGGVGANKMREVGGSVGRRG